MGKYIIRYRTNQQFHDDQLAKAGKDVQPGQDIWFPVPGVSFTDEAKVSDYNPIPKNVPTLIFVNETNQVGTVKLVAKQVGSGSYFNALPNRPAVTLEYSNDNQFFQTTASTEVPQTGEELTFTLPASGKLYLRGSNDTFAVGNIEINNYLFTPHMKYWSFTCDVRHTLDGSLMAVLNDDTAVTESFELAGLFEGDRNLVGMSDIVLSTEVVPIAAYAYTFRYTGLETMPKIGATTVQDFGCFQMFKESSFTALEDLNATTLGKGAYANMFQGCTGLVDASIQIPNAEYVCFNETDRNKWAAYCWAGMFEGCTAMKYAPEIMQEKAYARSMLYMFGCCSGLEEPPVIHLNDLNTGYGDDNGANECLGYMFKGCTSLKSTPTFLADIAGCGSFYGMQYMFSGCTSLTNAGVLGMTGISHYVCYQMFAGCTSLVNPPDMSRLSRIYNGSCLTEMFRGCTKLKDTPQLSLSVIYHLGSNRTHHLAGMFRDCTDLTGVTITLPRVGYYTCQSMFQGCTSLRDLSHLVLPSETNIGCYENMFAGCTGLTIVTLPATNLAQQCYWGMFSGCTSLTDISALFLNDLNDEFEYVWREGGVEYREMRPSYTWKWLDSASATGTLKNLNNVDWDYTQNRDESHLPAGWTVQDA